MQDGEDASQFKALITDTLITFRKTGLVFKIPNYA